MTFHKNSLKLAGLYLSILMAISIFFSVNVYELSVQELERGLRRSDPHSVINRLPFDTIDDHTTLDAIMKERENQYQVAQDHILSRLILVNVIILVSGGILSYYFAVRTLRPIEEANEAQGRFTADASHELRTPIAAMQAETEVALMDPKLNLSKAKAILSSNIEELEKLTALSEALLRLAQADNESLPKKELDMADIVNNSVKRVKVLADKRKIKLEVAKLPSAKVVGDEASLVEAVVVILDNAIKYSPEKSTVSIALNKASKQALVSVNDQGVGIKPSELTHIFERFYRADSARSKTDAGGYGLGLSLAKKIIDAHQGKISVTSKPSKGTGVTIRLPIS